MQFYDFLPAPNPLIQATDPEMNTKITQIKKRDEYNERDSSKNLWDYFTDNKQNLVYQRYDNYPWSMIPLNNHRFTASYFFDCKKLISLNREIKLTEFQSVLYKYLFPSTMKQKEFKTLSLEQDNKNYSGLKFDSHYESANLFASFRISTYEYDLIMQNDTNSKGHTQWFYFSVENTQKNTLVTFNIINFIKNESLFNLGQRPVVYSIKSNKTKGIGWIKAGTNVVYFKNKYKKENSTTKTYYTLSFSYKFEYSNDKVYFAQCYPYTYSQLNSFIDRVIKINQFSNVKELCKTMTRSQCPLITIGKGRKAILLMARQHPGETPSSYAIEGAIEFLIRNCIEAEMLRNYFTFYIIPMLNPDGVIFGNYRCNLYGTDLNRIWINPHKELHDSVWYIRDMIKQINQSTELSMIIDFHGHSKKFNSFFYANSGADSLKLFPLICSKISKMVNLKDCSFSIHESKKKTARAALQEEVKSGYIYTLESSFHAYKRQFAQDFNDIQYKELGVDIMLSMFKLFQQDMIQTTFEQNINFKLPTTMNSQQNNDLDLFIKNYDLSQLQLNQDDSGSDTNPEEDVLQDQEQLSITDSRKQSKAQLITKKKIIKIDKGTQTDISHYQNLMLDEKVLLKIEEQVKTLRKNNNNLETIGILGNDVEFQEGQKCEFQQTDISLQQILGRMQVFHVRVSNKNSMFQHQFTTQSSKPVVIVLKNPYSKQQLQQNQQTTYQQEQLSIKNRRRVASINGRASIDSKRLANERKYSIQHYQQEKYHGYSYQYNTPINFMSQDTTFDKIANISKARFNEKQIVKNQF
ncbi:unnamed protein product [Paramecium octaurelia]|uniref:Peptidase M14 domain-containing protein n=1 Tax=Paramecium octaurelia TaxID=43137 RepID=A0A8S1UAR9_PAROT|nr:unnamed protein product [Paramecium octaurelia]